MKEIVYYSVNEIKPRVIKAIGGRSVLTSGYVKCNIYIKRGMIIYIKFPIGFHRLVNPGVEGYVPDDSTLSSFGSWSFYSPHDHTVSCLIPRDTKRLIVETKKLNEILKLHRELLKRDRRLKKEACFYKKSTGMPLSRTEINSTIWGAEFKLAALCEEIFFKDNNIL